jgi:hypothetical protein
MTEIEDRLRDAFRADAQTVRPQIRPFVSPGTRLGRPVGDRPRGKFMVPITAAATVALVAVGTTVVLPRVLANRDHHAPASGIAAGYPGGRMPSGPPPKFFVAITSRQNKTPSPATNVLVIDATTGQITGRLAPPAAHRYFQAVAPLGNDRTFVAEASGIRCDTWFYKFTLTAAGKPTGLTPLDVPMVPGTPIDPPSPAFATSLSRQVVAFATGRCTPTNIRSYDGQVGAANLSTRKVTMWRLKWPATPFSLSLTSDGKLLAFVSNPSSGTREGSPEFNSAWVVRTDSASGPLAARYRRVFGAPAWPTAAVLSPNGRLIWAIQPRAVPIPHRLLLTVHQTATGKLLRTWRIFPWQRSTSQPNLSASVSGRYLLVFGYTSGVEKLDLATRKLTKVPWNNGYFQIDVAW